MGWHVGLNAFDNLPICSGAAVSVAGFVRSWQLQVKNAGKDVEPGVASGKVAGGKQLVGSDRGHFSGHLAMVIDLPGGTCPEFPV